MKIKEFTHSEDPIDEAPSSPTSPTSPHVGDHEGGTKKPNGNDYEVFLSFRGKDTRKGFADHLYTSLVDAGIRVFRDDNELRVGEEIGPKLLCSVTQSKISIPIISEDYASSKWCLSELVQMLKCRSSRGQVVLPIFYKMNPSQLRQLTKKFEDTINEHKGNLDEMVAKEWEEALKKISSIKGRESEKIDNGHEAALVKTVVRRVSELKRHFQLIAPRAPIKLHSDSLKPLRRRILSWQKVKLLGRGAFASVYEGISDDVFCFAIKEVPLLESGFEGEARLQLQQEICLLSQFDHENIVRCLGSDKDDKKLYLFLELMPKGSLATLYRKYKLRDSHVSEFTRQIVNALKYLHDQKVVHRDIKCANILVDASGSVKLAGFGQAEAIKMSAAQTVAGTVFWMAPEIINLRLRSSQSNGSYGLEVDIWSLGCTVLEMLTRRPPYSHLEGVQALFRIGRGELPRVPKSLSSDARDFILTCLRENPKDRPSAAQLLDHPFVRKPPATSGFASPCSFRSSL